MRLPPRRASPLSALVRPPLVVVVLVVSRIICRLIIVVDASNVDWNVGNNIIHDHPVLVEGDSRDACERRGGVWAPLSPLSDSLSDFGGENRLVYPNWFVQLLFLLVFLLSGILFTTLYLVWLCFGRKNFSMYVHYNVEQTDKTALLSPSSPSASSCSNGWPYLALRLFRRCRPPSMRRGILFILALTGVTLLLTAYYATSFHHAFALRSNDDDDDRGLRSKTPPVIYACKMPANASDKSSHRTFGEEVGTATTEVKLLVMVETPYSPGGVAISALLEANRFHFRVEPIRNKLPTLTTGAGTGRYAVVVFENLHSYLRLNKFNREVLDLYCQHYGAGLVLFSKPAEETFYDSPLKGIPDLTYSTNVRLKDVKLNPESSILRLLKPGQILRGKSATDWTTFSAEGDDTFVPVATAEKYVEPVESDIEEERLNQTEYQTVITVMEDIGAKDGVRRVFFGHGLNAIWLHKILFLDAISHLSQGRIAISMDRYIQVDIDDIFVGKIRMDVADVLALVGAQKTIQKTIPGFKFVLGFSGQMYHKGSANENAGEDYLLSRADEFLWFGHMWKHTQAHRMNVTQLLQEMNKNLRFAQDHGIPILHPYSVAPHHSGVFPVHEPLYHAWKKVWGIKVTSTEEYPHQKPAFRRKGFVYKDIYVLPRQTCGLFTHTYLLDRYPNGPSNLYRSIEGGELFQTIVFNQISIFMTHMSNYARDRLALVTFQSVINFISCWTNIRLMSAPPLALAQKYFDLYPEERSPVWRDPCADPKHRDIWSSEKRCGRLPDFVIVGPQKTGTTALHWFLSLHPKIFSSVKSSETFEEVQFFNGKNYYRGVDWYMDFFPPVNRSEGEIVFEKSANYFDQEMVPPRLSALLPDGRVIVIVISAKKRAYSWYQHMRAHKDPTAIAFTFHQVITGSAPTNANKTQTRALRQLRKHCLEPGFYAQHLTRWLAHKKAQKLLVIDGETLKTDPFSVMNEVQDFLDVEKIDYSKLIKFDTKKGFFCQIKNDRQTVCLGKGKGRRYPSMDLNTEKYLQKLYEPHNSALVKMLRNLGYAVPDWLEEDLLAPAEI